MSKATCLTIEQLNKLSKECRMIEIMQRAKKYKLTSSTLVYLLAYAFVNDFPIMDKASQSIITGLSEQVVYASLRKLIKCNIICEVYKYNNLQKGFITNERIAKD